VSGCHSCLYISSRKYPAQGSPLARELFAFDPAGNLLDTATAPNGQPVDTTLGVVGDNRLRFYQDLHFEYDVHGNVTKRTRGNQKAGTQEVLDLTWNADHPLIESNTTRHGVTQATRYAYDPLGRRVSKSDAFGSTHYLWDGDLMVHSQRGARQALYIYEPGSFVPLATIQGAGEEQSTYWYQCDQIGAPLELTDEQGQVAWAADYKVWGEAVMRSVLRTGTDDRPVSAPAWGSKPVAAPPPPPIEQPFRFQGQQFDEETGLHYNRFRYYDPATGRFISEDPIKLLGGANLFIYSPNPIVWLDPYGLAGEGALGTYGSLNTKTHRGDNMEAHELIRHEALAQMGCTKKGKNGDDLRMRANPSIALSNDRHDIVHANEIALSQQYTNTNGKNTFQFGTNGKPSKQQMDVWQGALRQSGISASQAKKLRKMSNNFLKNLCCCSTQGTNNAP
jgi:RHS repeat-associated protein